MNLLLFWIFFKSSIFTFGGGYAMLSIYYDELVTKRNMLTGGEFADLLSLAQITPGPIGLNAATFIGQQQGGMIGALCATAGAITPALTLGILVSFAFQQFKDNNTTKSVLAGIRPVCIGLIAAAVIFFAETSIFTAKLSLIFSNCTLKINWPELIIFAIILYSSLRYKVNPIWLIISGGILGLILHI